MIMGASSLLIAASMVSHNTPGWGWFLFATIILIGNAVNESKKVCVHCGEKQTKKVASKHPMDDAVDYYASKG
jgi:hypothetical protein